MVRSKSSNIYLGFVSHNRWGRSVIDRWWPGMAGAGAALLRSAASKIVRAPPRLLGQEGLQHHGRRLLLRGPSYRLSSYSTSGASKPPPTNHRVRQLYTSRRWSSISRHFYLVVLQIQFFLALAMFNLRTLSEFKHLFILILVRLILGRSNIGSACISHI